MTNFWQQLVRPFLILAPMEDVTDVVFREIVTQLPRPDVFFTEFTSSDALTSAGREKALFKLQFTENQRPIVAQIWGTTPDHYHQAAQLIQELKFDGIDINMGCPVKKVLKIGAGSAHCLNHELTAEIIAAVKAGAPHLPLSVKTRLGNKKNVAAEWIPFLLEQNIQALTIHGRTAAQMSTGEANWEEIGKAVSIKNTTAPETVIIGNGDILSYSQALRMHEEHGVDGVMIGRGVFTNPWVFEKSLEPSPRPKEEYLKVLLRHVALHHQTWGDSRRFEIMKKFFKMYVRDFDNASELRQKLMECEDSSQVVEVIRAEGVEI